eukprot:scaffold53377_cov81-Phaeocystis_antarctica.AAC.1
MILWYQSIMVPEYHGTRVSWNTESTASSSGGVDWGGSPRARAAANRQTTAPPPPALPPPRPPRRPRSPFRGAARPMATAGA